MRIRLDRTLCDGFGICAKHAPEHFPLDDWGYASLEGDGDIAPEHRDGVLRALLDCPAHAIIAMREPAAEESGDSAGSADTSAAGPRPPSTVTKGTR